MERNSIFFSFSFLAPPLKWGAMEMGGNSFPFSPSGESSVRSRCAVCPAAENWMGCGRREEREGGRCKEMKEERKKKGGGGKALSLFILSFSFRVVSSREYQ